MKPFFATLAAAMLITATPTLVKAGPIMKMLEEKKAKQATGTSSTAPTSASTPAAAAPASKNPAFDTAKQKCKQLGNKEGSDKFNSCVMTLME